MNFENLLDQIGITVSTVASFLFFVKLVYMLYTGKINKYNFNFIQNIKKAICPKNIILFICNVPILFYAISICSTSVILAFIPMILRCYEIHICTFYIFIFLFFTLATITRYITVSLLSNNQLQHKCHTSSIKNNDIYINNQLKYYLYLLIISPIVFDTTCFRRSAEIVYSIFPNIYNLYLDNTTFYSSVYIGLSIVVVYLLQRSIKYVSHSIMIMFLIIIISSILNLDTSSFTGLFKITNNKLTFYGLCMSMFYANLFAIYICDLFCICIEYVYVRYVDRELINKNIISETNRYPFYMFTSIVISTLSLIWVLIFINIGITNILYTSESITITIIRRSLNIIFLIQSFTNMYFLYDFIKLSNHSTSYLLLPMMFVFNYFWNPSVSIISLITYLISQLISCVVLVRKL